MYFELKENKPHGTKDDPFSTYHIENAGRSFQIPVHWHDEFEIIYVRSGFLTVSISGESYIGKTGEEIITEILQLIIAPELSLSKIIKTAPSTLFSNSRVG